MENLKIPDERVKFDIVIYLKVSTAKAKERIAKRGRASELLVDDDYWEKLNKRYDDFYKKHKNDFHFALIDAETDDLEQEMHDVMEAIYQKDPQLRPL